MSQWADIYELVTTGDKPDEAKAVIEALVKVVGTPNACDGLSTVDVGDIGATISSFPLRAVAKRALRAAIGQCEAKRARTTLPVAPAVAIFEGL